MKVFEAPVSPKTKLRRVKLLVESLDRRLAASGSSAALESEVAVELKAEAEASLVVTEDEVPPAANAGALSTTVRTAGALMTEPSEFVTFTV